MWKVSTACWTVRIKRTLLFGVWCPLTIASIAVPDPLRPRLNASDPGLDSSVVCHSAEDPG